MITVQQNATAYNSFILRDKKGDPVDADAGSPGGVSAIAVTLNGVANAAIVPTIEQATDGNSPGVPITGQYEISFPTNYAGVAPGDVIVVRIQAVIAAKVKTALLKFVVDPGDIAEPSIDVS
jgi:hypothetical protein